MSHPQSRMLVLMTADAIGGVWNYCLRLAEALQAYDVQIALAVMGPAPSEYQRRDVGRLSNVRLYESTFKLEWMQDPWHDVARAGQWLLCLERYLGPSLVHLNSYVHASLPWSSPVLVVAHSCVCSWFEAVRKCEPTGEWNEYRRRVREGLRCANMVTAPSGAALEILGRHYGSFRSAGPIYNGCEPVAAQAGEAEDIVFSAGRLWDPAKGTAVLDRAAKDIHWPVFAAGAAEGPDGQRIELRNIQGPGYLDQQTLAAWYRRAAIFVLPSLYEPFGLAALEAGLSNCALVLSDLPSLREIWSDAAFFTRPGDHEAIADIVNRLIIDPALRQEYGRRARQKAGTYTLRRMAEDYRRLYLDLLQRRRIVPAAVSIGST